MIEQLYALVNERYESQRSLVVTTNLDQGDLEEQIGERVVSRLVEICGDPLPIFDDDAPPPRLRRGRRLPRRERGTLATSARWTTSASAS